MAITINGSGTIGGLAVGGLPAGTVTSTTLESSIVPSPGTTAFFGMTTAPNGWIKANGAAISRTTYAALFGVIGTTFGSGDGSTTFNVPDLRGEFPRGWDDSRGVDSGRSLGSAQTATGVQGAVYANIGYGRGWGSDANLMDNEDTSTTVGVSCWGGWIGYNSGAPGSASMVRYRVRPRNIALLACIKY